MNKKYPNPVIQLNMIVLANRTHCYWCGQALRQCGMCKGSGLFRGSNCKPCNSSGRLCPVHEGDWEQ